MSTSLESRLIKKVPFLLKDADPTTADNYLEPPYLWLNRATNTVFILVDVTAGVATWYEFAFGSLVNAILKAIVTTKGDIIGASGSAVPVRFPIGTDTFVLTANSAQALGLEWVSPGAPAAHAATHEPLGADEISVAGLSGELADDQPPKAHASDHTDGTDDIQSATNLQKGVATAAQITALELAVTKQHDRSHSIVSTSDHSDVANFVDGPLSPGVLTGGLISEGTEGTVTVSAITALLRTDVATTDPLVYVELAEQANNVIGSADTKYHVGLDYNGGVPQILVQTANFNRTTEIGLGTCMKDTSVPVRTHFSNGGMRHQDGVSKLQQRASTLRRTELAPGGGGCAIADVGGGSLQFSIQSGIVYHGIYRMTPFDAPPYDPYISGDDGYFLVYGDTATGFTISDGTDTAINNTQYWNTTTHALALVTPNQYACHWVYIHTDDEDVYVVLGDDSYKLAEAQLAQPLSDLPIEISEFGLLLGCIIVERNATAFELIQMVTDTFFTGSAVGIHNSLGGLNVGDYQHLLETEYIELSAWLDDVVLGSDGLTSVPEVVLIPRAAALSDTQGGMYYSSVDDSVYVCTSAT